MEITKDFFGHPGLRFPRSPHNAQGEDLLGSLYRAFKLVSVKEQEVGDKSKNLYARINDGFQKSGVDSPSGFGDNDFKSLITNQIASPIADAKKQIVRMSPITPEIAKYSGVPVYGPKTWNPGNYILGMISRSIKEEEFNTFVTKCMKYLSVNDEESAEEELVDDLWSRFIECELKAWDQDKNDEDSKVEWMSEVRLDLPGVESPDKLFVLHFPMLLSLKSKMTRRKWVSLIESYLRLVMMYDIIWICQVHHVLLDLFTCPEQELEITSIKSKLDPQQFFKPGVNRNELVKLHTRRYARSTITVNNLYESLKSEVELPSNPNLNEIAKYYNEVRARFDMKEIKSRIVEINEKIDLHPDIIAEFNGGGRIKNIVEFLEHAPKKQEPEVDSKNSYDQGYWFNKIGLHRAAPWEFQPGSVGVYVMAYLNCKEERMSSVSVDDHLEFIGRYGMAYNQSTLALGQWGNTLRALGLIVSSPDADGGIMIQSPVDIE